MPGIYKWVGVFLFLLCARLLPSQGGNTVVGEDKAVLIAILARNKAHVLDRYLRCIERLDYDKKRIVIYINTNNNEDATKELLQDWARKNGERYRLVVFEDHEIQGLSSTDPHEWTAERFKVLGKIRNKSMQKAREHDCDYYFVVDCDNFITPCTLKELVNKEKPIIAPMLRSVPELVDCYSNYFCGVTDNGYYADHPDYFKILYRSMIGTFKVPVVHCTYLIDSKYIDKLTYVDETSDFEFVIFSRGARKNSVEQYICNERDFGSLLHFHTGVTLEEEQKKVLHIPWN